ncbi:hypothetical protein IL59_0200475, partial [Brucella suis bv. 4 str. 40]
GKKPHTGRVWPGFKSCQGGMKLHGGALRLEDNGPVFAPFWISAAASARLARAHPEKCETVFGKDARQNKGLKRRSD